MKSRLITFIAILFAVSAASAISFGQRTRETAEKPVAGDFRITIKTISAGGQSQQGTTMIKGKRERSESTMTMGGMNTGSTNVMQCDLRRNIQINDRTRKYLITPMDSDDDSAPAASAGDSEMGGQSRRGGVVTITTNTVDTGERKEMFGFTARHLKRTMTMEASPDSCYQLAMRMETEGWYINLEYGLNCGSERPPQIGRMAPAGCRDRYQNKRTGPASLGYPLLETTTVYGAGGAQSFTSTKEVIELSRQPLDAALFDVPAGYTEAKTQQEMSGAPSMAEIMAIARQQSGQANTGSESSNTSMPSTAHAAIRVGVVEFNNKAKTPVSTDSLRGQLIGLLNGEGIDAIALNASSPSEAAIEAKAKQCTHILYTDITTMKSASAGKKIGGLLGRATGIGSGSSGQSEARFDFRLIPVGSSSPLLQSSATGKEDNDQSTVTAAIEGEAKAVAAAVQKN